MSIYWPAEPALQTSGKARLRIGETVNQRDNSSTVTVALEIYPTQMSYRYIITGRVTVNGQAVIPTTNGAVAVQNQWTEIWAQEFVIPHDPDGRKTISIAVERISSGWPDGLTAYAYVNGVYYTVYVPSGTTQVQLTAIDNGSKVRIGSNKYSIYIGNGTGFDRYDAYIGNGSTFARY